MSQGAILILIAVGSFCIWMATHPAPPRNRRSDPRNRHEDGAEDADDAYPSRLRRREEREADVARIRLQASGRNRWDRRDLERGVGRDPGLHESNTLIWPNWRRIKPSNLVRTYR